MIEFPIVRGLSGLAPPHMCKDPCGIPRNLVKSPSTSHQLVITVLLMDYLRIVIYMCMCLEQEKSCLIWCEGWQVLTCKRWYLLEDWGRTDNTSGWRTAQDDISSLSVNSSVMAFNSMSKDIVGKIITFRTSKDLNVTFVRKLLFVGPLDECSY